MAAVAQVAAARPQVASRAGVLPWYLIAMLAGSTSIVLGVLWDISWHLTIGRDTFWSPPHAAVYLGGVLAGFSAGIVALRTTFAGSAQEQAAAVRLWGFRAPLGAWVTIWGSFAMLVSAPFDDWWHNAYGLDVGSFTPPHSLLIAGMITIQLGVMFLALALQNQAAPGEVTRLGVAHLFAAGIVLLMIIPVHLSEPNRRHSALFYQLMSAVLPFALVGIARSSRLRWAATITAVFYMLITLLMVWILPLFSAHPKLGPVNMRLEHMSPPLFPLLLVVPALAIDALLQRREGKRGGWLDAAAMGTAFLASFFVVHWYFAEFQLSPLARNWFFAGDRFWSYFSLPGAFHYQFWMTRENPMTPGAFILALLLATFSARLGLGCGGWMSRVKR
jgi:hypothetical protein